MNVNEIIETVSNNTLEVLKQAYQKSEKCLSNKIQTRMIYPHYRNNEIRVSEQELRIIFIEELNKFLDIIDEQHILFSIETPTIEKYSFSDKPIMSKKGRSGNIDLVLYNTTFERIALIEFKALNPIRKHYEKDFVKLANEIKGNKYIEGYFIQIVKNDLQFKSAVEAVKGFKNKYSESIIYICYSLEGESYIIDLI